jgi:membrane protein implicated in regulation of membrane protease activity
MNAAIVTELGSWTWWIIGLALLILEIILPGVFMLWFGIAAMIVGTVSLMIGESAIWSWQVQLIAFAVLSLASAIIGRKYWYNVHPDTDQPHLNERGEQMIGKVSVLMEALENGAGRIKLGDTVWRVVGPDLPAGSKVRVIGSDANKLEVEAV